MPGKRGRPMKPVSAALMEQCIKYGVTHSYKSKRGKNKGKMLKRSITRLKAMCKVRRARGRPKHSKDKKKRTRRTKAVVERAKRRARHKKIRAAQKKRNRRLYGSGDSGSESDSSDDDFVSNEVAPAGGDAEYDMDAIYAAIAAKSKSKPKPKTKSKAKAKTKKRAKK